MAVTVRFTLSSHRNPRVPKGPTVPSNGHHRLVDDRPHSGLLRSEEGGAKNPTVLHKQVQPMRPRSAVTQ
jgi:hypothetical protein